MLSSCVVLATLSIGSAAFACDRHGGTYGGFGMSNAPWQTYNPKVSTMDPAMTEDSLMDASSLQAVAPAKSKPSFSNAANNAALKAKMRLSKKATSDKKAVTEKKPT